MKTTLTLLTASLVGKKMCGRKWETCNSISCRLSFCHSILAVLFCSSIVLAAADAPKSTAFPDVNSKCVFRRLQSGNILLIRHGQDIRKATPARQGLTAFLTIDEGKPWSGKLLLDQRTGVSYPDIAQAPNGDIFVHYDRNRYGDAEILFARFREEDVKVGKLVSEGASLKNIVKARQA